MRILRDRRFDGCTPSFSFSMKRKRPTSARIVSTAPSFVLFVVLVLLVTTSSFAATTHHHHHEELSTKPNHHKKHNHHHGLKSSTPTRVTGYGSHHHRSIGSSSSFDKEKPPLFLSESSDESSLLLHSLRHNRTLEIRPGCALSMSSFVPGANKNPSSRRKMRTKEKSWTAIEGLFGVYKVPSGHIWVWIASTEPVYEAPRLESSSQTSWWDIRRVAHLHLTHVVEEEEPAEGGDTLNPQQQRQQRQEQRRQLSLLRKALKSHQWYYSRGTLVPDLTYRLQDCFTSSNSVVTLSASNGGKEKWWWLANDNNNETDKMCRRPDSRFFWNEELVEPVEQQYHIQTKNQTDCPQQILLEHVIPVTSAFCGIQQNLTVGDGGQAYDQILLSRRSRFRAGTRFTTRGADATGAVANYAETEQIMFQWKHPNSTSQTNALQQQQRILTSISSHVQTRGSIPLRWSSPTDIKTYRPRVRIGTNPLSQARAMRQHLVDETSRYLLARETVEKNTTALASTSAAASSAEKKRKKSPGLLFVNLIDKKSDQKRLGRALDSVLEAVLDVYSEQPDPGMPWLHRDNVQHLWFDFHAEVKSGRWDRLTGLLDQVKRSLLDHGYFYAVPTTTATGSGPESAAFDIQKLQTGVVRTNCMDCLDRTNVVQSLFGRFMLFRQLSSSKAAGVSMALKTCMQKNPMTLPWPAGEKAHRLLWADNADAISRLYAGTPALKGDFTRTGKRTKKGALDDGMNSLQRYYLNNFLDADRQEGLDLLTGFQPFSNTAGYEGEGSDDGGGDSVRSSGAGQFGGLSIQEAARQMLLGFPMDQPMEDDDDRDHMRIKLSTGKKQTSSRSLELLWLPGDLRSHLRSLALSSSPTLPFADSTLSTSVESSDMSVETPFCPLSSLESVDRRSEAQLPWWVTAEDSSDTEESEEAFAAKRNPDIVDSETAAMNNDASSN